MLTQRANIHRHKVPKIGAIVRFPGLAARDGSWRGRWQIQSYPLTDSPDTRYAIGFHTCNVAKLGTAPGRATRRVAGHWAREDGDE